MPELPDVEVERRYADATALHRELDGLSVAAPSLLEGTTPQGLGRVLAGRSFEGTARHGKVLFLAIGDGRHVAIHFGMSGTLDYARSASAPGDAVFVFRYTDGSRLACRMPRKLGSLSLADSVPDFARRHGLGPDALALERQEFRNLAADRRGGVKNWLMDQSAMAGIGNVYSDEILYQAGLYPKRKAAGLNADETAELWRTMRRVLRSAIAAGADPDEMPASFLLPHRHAEGRCPACGGRVRRIDISGRGAWYCPGCQPPS